MDIVGVVEIIDGRIVLSGTMIYENYEMQNMFAGSWSTSKTKLEDTVGNLENQDKGKTIDQEVLNDILGSYTGTLTVRERTKELVSSLEEKIDHGMDVNFELLVDQDGTLIAQSTSTKYNVDVEGNIITIDMNEDYMGIHMKGKIETLSKPHVMSGDFEIWLKGDNDEENIYVGDWHIAQTEDVVRSNLTENNSVTVTNYLYQPGYRYEFETYRNGNTHAYQLLTFRLPGKSYSSFILIEDDEFKQTRHYYIEDDIAYTYLEGNEDKQSIYMPLELSVGTKWEGSFSAKEVHSIGGNVNSNFSKYSPILTVKNVSKDSDDVSLSYYAPSVGFIESETIEGEDQKTLLMNRAELSEAEKELIQSYYENALY